MEETCRSFTIMPADPKQHGQQILEMIKELAEFEGLKDQFQEVPIKNDLEKGYCNCFVAVSEGKTVGYALFYYAYSTWVSRFVHLEDLYVKPAYRKKGIGQALWKAVAKVCMEENISRLQWNVLNWNKNAIDFYKKQGAIDLHEAEGWIIYRLPKESIEKLAKE